MNTKDKNIVRAEIERQYKILKEEYSKTKGAYVAGRMDALDYVEQFINSLPKEPKIEAPYEIRFDPANGFDLGSVNVYRDGNLVAQRPEQWKWIDPKYEYPLCLTREMDEYGHWHYSLSAGKISETCQYISLAELERLPDEPVDADVAMKELDDKIKLTKAHGSWKGVDVDKFMDEVRGRESDDLEEAAEEYERKRQFAPDETEPESIRKAFKAGAEWQREQDKPITGNSLEKEWLRYVNKKKKEYGGELPSLGDYGWLQIARHFAEWQKQQMLKEAVEAEVADLNGELYNRCVECGLTDLDRVKIIILPVEKK